MIIATNTWHYRWYNYWLYHGRGNKPGRQENLCHYVRVLLFWAPATWIDQRWNLGIILTRGIAGLYIFALAGFLGYVFIILPAITQTTKFLMAIGSLAGLVGTLVALWYGVGFARSRRPAVPGTVKLAVGYAVAKKRRVCPFITFEEPAARRLL